MKDSFACPACALDDWERFGLTAYEARDHRTGGLLHDDSYVRLRRTVLFDLWFPGRERVELHTQFCRYCGFVCYAPRPETSDILAKYRYLQQTEKDIGGQANVSSKGMRLDERRALRIRDHLARYTRLSGRRLLDIGGGDGKLLAPFQAEGCQCCIVDYNVHPRRGVHRFGDTIQDVPPGEKFDLLICSHVLEHVAEPIPFLVDLHRLVGPNGLLYLEVPLEVWKRISILVREPVTHVNFFTPSSLATGLARAGFEALRCEAGLGSYGDARIEIVWAVARPRAGVNPISLPGSEATRRLVYPTLLRVMKQNLFVQCRLEGSLAPWARVVGRLSRKRST